MQNSPVIHKNNNSVILLLISAMFIWGSSWVSGKIISDDIQAEVTVFYRLALATLGMLPILALIKHFSNFQLKINRKAFLWAIPSGFLMASYNQLFFLGLHDGLPGKGGMLVTTTNPLFTFLLTIIFFKEQISNRQALGLALGLIGGLLMIEVWQFDPKAIFSEGNGYFLLAALTWAFLTLISKKGTHYADFITFSTLMYFWACIVSYLFALPYSPITAISSLSSEYWYHMLYLSVVVISIATSIFFFAAQKLGPSKATSFVFIVPVSALSLSAWYFSETINIYVALGGVFALSAVFLLNKPKKYK